MTCVLLVYAADDMLCAAKSKLPMLSLSMTPSYTLICQCHSPAWPITQMKSTTESEPDFSGRRKFPGRKTGLNAVHSVHPLSGSSSFDLFMLLLLPSLIPAQQQSGATNSNAPEQLPQPRGLQQVKKLVIKAATTFCSFLP